MTPMAMSPRAFYASAHRGNTFGLMGSSYGPLGHRGQDFNRWGAGTPIPSWVHGTVVVNTQYKALGYTVIIEVDDAGLFAGFCHMQLRSPLAVGQHVSIGDEVGHLGATGTAAVGPHLHATLEPTVDIGTARAIDPLPSIITAIGLTPAGGDGTAFDNNPTPAPQEDLMDLLCTSDSTHFGTGQRFVLTGQGPLRCLVTGEYALHLAAGVPSANVDADTLEKLLISLGLWEYASTGTGAPGPLTGRILGGPSGVDESGSPAAAFPRTMPTDAVAGVAVDEAALAAALAPLLKGLVTEDDLKTALGKLTLHAS
jgi:hypothetical protein